MTLDDLSCTISLNVRVTPTEDGIIGKYRVGVAGHAFTIPTDVNMLAVRDITVATSTSYTLHLDDFHLDSESAAWKTADNTDVDLVTTYAVLAYIVTSSVEAGETSLIKLTTANLGTNAILGSIELDGITTINGFWINCTGIGWATGSTSDLTVLEQTGDNGSTLRVIAIGKDS